MKKILSFLFFSALLISCSTGDNVTAEQQNRGSIEMEYNGEKLSFGKNGYNGWLLNTQNDTIARFYTARITKDYKNYYDIRLFAYLNQNNQLNKLEMEFIPVLNGSGWTYQYSLEEKPMVYKNIEFDGTWLKADFEGMLYYSSVEDKEGVHFTNGKINVLIKGLDIDWSQW